MEKKTFKERLKAIFTKERILRLVKQPSTIRALIVLAGLAGYTLDPSLIEQVMQGVVAAIAVYEALRDEEKGKEG